MLCSLVKRETYISDSHNNLVYSLTDLLIPSFLQSWKSLYIHLYGLPTMCQAPLGSFPFNVSNLTLL